MFLLSRNNYNEVFPPGNPLVARREPGPTTDRDLAGIRGLAILRSNTRASSCSRYRLISLSNMRMSCSCLRGGFHGWFGRLYHFRCFNAVRQDDFEGYHGTGEGL